LIQRHLVWRSGELLGIGLIIIQVELMVASTTILLIKPKGFHGLKLYQTVDMSLYRYKIKSITSTIT